MKPSLLPESPRFLVANDRSEEAAAVLVKYHAEGDANSQLVQAEIVQIRETIKTEMEVSKQSWLDLLRTSGMRRRVLVTVFVGLFTQLSGNTLISYYSGILFQMMGYTSNYAKTRINLAYACWGLINATIIALVVTRFKRRHMYMLSACLMLVTFIAITVSLERLQAAQAADVKNRAAGIAALFFYFAFSPTYNIGNNALTYSKFKTQCSYCPSNHIQPTSLNSGLTHNEAVVSVFNKSLASSQDSSPQTSTRLRSMPSNGVILPFTVAGSSLSFASSSCYTLRRVGELWRNSLSVRPVSAFT